jgi:hypothetical protein
MNFLIPDDADVHVVEKFDPATKVRTFETWADGRLIGIDTVSERVIVIGSMIEDTLE